MSFHNHEHNHSHAHSTNTRILRVSLAVIAGFMLVEAAAGWLSGSLALLSDAGHMFSDAASLALALFAFNLVPLLPLDGGHVAGACWEGLRRLRARWRARPDPGHVDTARMLPVGQVVFVALIVMAVVLIWVDVVATF